MRLIFHEMRVLTRGQGGPVLWLSPGPRLLLFYKHCNTGWPHTIWNFCYPRVIFQAIFQTQTSFSCCCSLRSPMDGAPTNYSTNNALRYSKRRLNWEPSHPALPFVTLISVSTWAVPLSMMLFTLCLLRLISGFFWFIFQPQFVWIFTLFHFYKLRHNCFLFFPSKNWDFVCKHWSIENCTRSEIGNQIRTF